VIDDESIIAIIGAELANAEAEENDLETPLDYYLGNPNGLEVNGNSQVTSTDVADAIEWIMPQIMKSFTQTNEVVVFDPVHEGDEDQAQIESAYTYDVLMKQNDGFVAIHQFAKDALLQNNGILKVYYENSVKETTSEYTGVDAQTLVVILSDPNVEVMELTEREEYSPDQQIIPVVDIKVKYTHKNGRIIVESIPREDFRINSDHNSINADKARFTAHVTSKTASELIEAGYDSDIINDANSSSYDESSFRFESQGENITFDESLDKSLKEIDIAECFTYMDINEDGIAERVKITLIGGDTPTHVLDIEEVSAPPWVTTTAILMSHKFKGLSIYDRLKEIQDQKTSLWRNMFDNLYLQNNQRTVVVDGQVELDDLLISRPGGIIRAKTLDSVKPLVTPSISDGAQMMMGYLDEVGAGRVGVSAEGAASPQNIGENVGSQGLDRLMNAKEELVGLIIRVIAETGLKPLFTKIRDLSRDHSDAVKGYKFKGEWVDINPASWMDRTSSTVRVGTGTGDRQAQVAAVREVILYQEKIVASGQQSLLGEQQVYDALDDFCKFSGLPGASKYYIDPRTKEGQEKKQEIDKSNEEARKKQDEMDQQMIKAQTDIANAEMGKAKATMQGVGHKAESDIAKNQLQLFKQGHDAEIKMLETQLSEAKLFTDSRAKIAELELREEESDRRFALDMTRIEKESGATDENANYESNLDTVSK